MLRRLFVVLFLCVCSALLVSTTKSQVVGQPYRLSDKDLEKVIRRIEQQSDRFRSGLDSALDKSRFNGSNREDDINSFVKDFYSESKKLRDRFDDHKSTAPDVQSVLERAARIDGFMRRYPLSSRAQEDWSRLKSYLDELAAAYNVSWRWTEFQSENRGPIVPSPNGTAVGMPYRVSDREVEKILRRIEQQSDRFRSALDSSLDKSRLNGTREEDDINRLVKEFYEQTKTLRDRFDDHKTTSDDVQSVLDRGARIDSFMRRSSENWYKRNRSGKNQATREWARLRSELDQLASVYNVSWQWTY